MNQLANFDRLARLYRWMEWASFGPYLWWCRCAFLDDLSSSRCALALGDGDGRFTARLLQANSSVQVDAVDASSAMLDTLVRRAGPGSSRVRTHQADVRQWQPGDRTYDLVVTHFFLDCLTTHDVQSLATTLRGAVTPSALWVISEFAIPDDGFGSLLAESTVWALYRAFGWLTGLTVRALPRHSTVLAEAGFILQKRRSWLGGLLISELWSALPADSL